MSDYLNPSISAKANTTIAYTDGACKNNPGIGGWGAWLIFSDGQTQSFYGGEEQTTNNRMELMGAIQALVHSPKQHTLEIWTDSKYVYEGITQWIYGWKKRQWKNVKNKELWQQLDELCKNRLVQWYWLKGHAGHLGNEKADELANLGIQTLSTPTNSTKQNTPSHPKPSQDWLEADPLGFGISNEYDDMDTDTDMATEQNHHLNDLNDDDRQIHDDDIAMVNTNPAIHPTTPHQQNSKMTKTMTPHSQNTQNTQTNPVPSHFPNENASEPIEQFDGDTSQANSNFRPLLPAPAHKSERDRQLIMDTETTGLDPREDRIIEVGIVELVGRKFTGQKLHVYINPQRSMSDEVIAVHGISEAFLADKPTFEQVAQQIYDFMAGSEVIAHNAGFDISFLEMEFNKAGLTDFSQSITITDTLALAKQQYPGQKNTLDALVKRLNVGKQDRTFHGALLDAEILAEVYLAMTGGQVALAIDDDIQSENGSSHQTFAHLANKLITSTTDEDAHQQWLAQLAEKFPALQNNPLT